MKPILSYALVSSLSKPTSLISCLIYGLISLVYDLTSQAVYYACRSFLSYHLQKLSYDFNHGQSVSRLFVSDSRSVSSLNIPGE